MLFDWPSAISEKDMLDLIDLMNTVAVKETTLGFFEPLTPDVGMPMMESLNADLKKEACHLLIARNASNKIVGMMILAQQSLPARRHIVEMRRCVIEPQYRGQFIFNGWHLALIKVQQMKCDIIILDVRSDGKAERLWRLLGFKEYGRLDDYARVRERVITGFFLYAYLKDILAHKAKHNTYLHRVKPCTELVHGVHE